MLLLWCVRLEHSCICQTSSRCSYFDVKGWDDFDSVARKVMVSDGVVALDQFTQGAIQICLNIVPNQISLIESEGDLTGLFLNTTKLTCNFLFHKAELPYEWKGGTPIHGNSTCDLTLITKNQNSNAYTVNVVVGDMKQPQVDLNRSSLHSYLTNELTKSVETIKDNNEMRPYIQMFSHLSSSSKDIGFLNNYNETRFFKANFALETLYVSPVVKIDQKRTADKPNAIQAFFVHVQSAK